MTREEFEAVIAIEGKYLEIHMDMPAGRYHRKFKNKAMTSFRAYMWKWEPMYPYQVELRRLINGVQPDPRDQTKMIKRTIAGTRWCKTNHQAVKILQEAWEKGIF